MTTHLDYERAANGVVAGVDEAGRGPLAGPVVAAAVILPSDPALVPEGIDDSKVLTALQREELYPLIFAVAQVGVGVASVKEIDRWNILRASLLAMRRAVLALPTLPALALIDGNQLPRLPCAARAIVDGDAISCSIAAASIVAKVHRDRLMDRLARRHRGYGWEHNRGYASAEHRAALHSLGVTKHHRRSFCSVRQALGLEPELPLGGPVAIPAESP